MQGWLTRAAGTVAGRGLTAEEQAVWQDWLEHRQADVRLRLYEHYAPWMRTLAGHLTKPRQPLAEWGDYLHFSAEGLPKAIDRVRRLNRKAWLTPTGLALYFPDGNAPKAPDRQMDTDCGPDITDQLAS